MGTLNIVIAREAVEQKVAPVYDMVCWGCRERERKIKREAEQQRENEERRLRDEREVERRRSYPGILLKQAWNKRECERKRQQEVRKRSGGPGGRKTGAILKIVIACKAVEQKVHPVYATLIKPVNQI